MGRSGKLFKALVAGVKACKSPSKEKPEKDKSASKVDKDHPKKGNKEKCLWSLGKSSSRNRDSLAAAAAFLDAPEINSTQLENKHAPHSVSFTSENGCRPKGLVKAEDAPFTGGDPVELIKQEELAAIKIQAAYRRHQASQRVFRALTAVVRLQALARGQMVRKQASAALRCMQALVKVQALARGRRVRSSELGQLIQKHLQQTRQQRKRPEEGWVSSTATLQQLQAKAQSKQDAVMKRQRALVYAFSEQLNRCTPKQHPFSANEFQPDKSYWGWVWLERWTAAHPWGNLAGVTKEEYNREEMVKIIADLELNEESYDKDILPLKEPVRNSNIESTSSTEFVGDPWFHSQESLLAMEKQTMSGVMRMKEEHMHAPADVEWEKAEDKSAIETTVNIDDSVVKKAAPRSLPSPPPPPPPPPLYVKRAKPVAAHVTSSHKGQQAAISANTCSETPVAFEVPHLTSAKAAEPLVETCTSAVATHWKPEPALLEFPSSPAKDPIQLTSASLPVEAFTTQSTLQSHPELLLCYNQSTPTSSSITPEIGKALPADCDKANVLMPMPSASDFAPNSPSQPPSSPTHFSDVLMLPPQQHIAAACSPLFIPDVTYDDDMSNSAYTPCDNEVGIGGNNTTSRLESIHGFDAGKATMSPAESGSMDLKNHLVEVDMDVEEPESVDFKTVEVVQTESLPEASGGCDASVMSAGENVTEVSSSKHASPISKQGQHTEATSPSVPNYMTTTKSSQAKVRTLTGLLQKSDSPKQKTDSLKPRFDSSKQKMDSPKLKLDSPKQKLDSPKQKLDSPKQKPDFTTKRRHSLSALEGKGSPGAPKASLHVRASSKGPVASLKDASTENSPCPNGDSRRHEKPVAV